MNEYAMKYIHVFSLLRWISYGFMAVYDVSVWIHKERILL